jgi:hypothetical protein
VEVADAALIIETARTIGVLWTSERSAQDHLARRIEQGHLPNGATLDELDALIHQVLSDDAAGVYLDDVESPGVLIVASQSDPEWVVKLNVDARVVTAFPLAEPAAYLGDPARRYIGRAGKLIRT